MNAFKKLFAVLVLSLLSFAANAQYDIDQFFARGRQMLIDGKYANAIENFNILARNTGIVDLFCTARQHYAVADFLRIFYRLVKSWQITKRLDWRVSALPRL
jgi:hypothetical protein